MKLIIFSITLLSAIVIGCGNQVQQKTAGQIISNSWEGEDDLNEKDTWVTMRPPVILTKSDSGDVIALFVGEFAPKIKSATKLIGNHYNPDTDAWEKDYGIVTFGEPIELRIKVNDVVASPTTSIITTSYVLEDNYETRSFLASLQNLPPGTHTVTAEWRSKDTGARVGNRTLTVWETVRVP